MKRASEVNSLTRTNLLAKSLVLREPLLVSVAAHAHRGIADDDQKRKRVAEYYVTVESRADG